MSRCVCTAERKEKERKEEQVNEEDEISNMSTSDRIWKGWIERMRKRGSGSRGGGKEEAKPCFIPYFSFSQVTEEEAH